MAGAVGFNEDFLSGDDYEAILTIISEDCFEELEELNAQVSDIVKEVEVPKAAARFPCDNSDKICKSERGLRRHSNVKHGVQLSTVLDFEPKLTAEEFKKYALECSIQKKPGLLSKILNYLKRKP